MFDHLEDLSHFNASAREARPIMDSISAFHGGNKPASSTCPKCSGRGTVMIGYAHPRPAKCFTCQGEGTITNRRAGAIKARATAATNLDAKKAEFIGAHPDVVTYLGRKAERNDFCRSMLDSIATYGSLTERQLEAVRKGMAKDEAFKMERQAARTSEVDLSPIFTMFDKAAASGLKKLAYRAEGLVISPAKAHSANAGALYVKTVGGEYLGKVAGSKFIATREATDEHKTALAVIARNPSEAATAYGKRTGSCSCCGRELTDPRSIAQGIGPICAERWFG